MPRKYNGNRVGENVGLIEGHYSNKELTSLRESVHDISVISSNVEYAKEGELVTISRLLPPKIFKQARIDGVGVWQHSEVSGNSMTLSLDGRRYVNELVPINTYRNLSPAKKNKYYSDAVNGLSLDEFRQGILTLKAALPNKDKSTLTGGNLKQKILNEIALVERRTGISKDNFTLILSQDAINDLISYEIGGIDMILGDATRNGEKNYFGVGRLHQAKVSELPTDTYFIVSIPSFLGVVRFNAVTAPGFYSVSTENRAPSLLRFCAEDGYAFDYYDGKAGVVVTQTAYDEFSPTIEFIHTAMEVAVGTTIDAQYLIDNNGLRVFDETWEGGEFTQISDAEVVSNLVMNTIDTTNPGLFELTLDYADSAGNAAVTRTIVVKVSTSVVRTITENAPEIIAELEKLKAENEALRNSTVTTKDETKDVKPDVKPKDVKK